MWSLPLTMELKKSAVLAVSVVLCLASFVARVQAKAIEGEEVGCLFHGERRAPGEKFAGPIGQCSWYTCKEDGSIFGVTCPTFQVLPESGCNITDTDLTVPYPGCCPRAICPDEPPTPPTITLETVDQPEDI